MMALPNDPAAACAILHEYASRKPGHEEVQLAIAGLAHHREGVQVCAAQTLAAWRLHEAVPHLREWMHSLLTKKRPSWAAAGQAVKAPAACVDSSDATWVLDGYFGQEAATRRTHLLLNCLTSAR